MSGTLSYAAGLSAEDAVERDYASRGYPAARRRFRGRRGELDFVARDDDGYVFVEVKKSRSFARAAERLVPAQMRRILATAEEFLAAEGRGSLTPMRFDLALVNARGEIRVIENVFGAA